jgi:LysM repeat protein
MSNIQLGSLQDNYFYIDFVGKIDPTDIYRFSRPAAGSFQVSTEGFSGGLKMELLDDRGNQLKTISTSGTKPGTLSVENLGLGDYSLKVSPVSPDTNYQINLVVNDKVDPLTGLKVDSGFFTPDRAGEVGFDFLYDGGGFKGQLAIFSLQGMEKFTPGSQEFIKEAASRALSNSVLGHVVISDITEGTDPQFRGSLGKVNLNTGSYKGVKKFVMNPGEAFAVMLVPDGTVKEVFDRPDIGGNKRPLFSLSSIDEDDDWLLGQVADITGDGKAFSIEDRSITPLSDYDYDDVIFRLTGATGKAVSVKEVIAPAKDWTKSTGGKKLIDYITSKLPDERKPPVDTEPPLEPKPPTTPTPPTPTPTPAPTPTPTPTPPTPTPTPTPPTPPTPTPPTPTPPTSPVRRTPPPVTLPPTPPVDKQPAVDNTQLPAETQPPAEAKPPLESKKPSLPLIGIIDTGFAANNPDFDYSKVTLGRDRTDNDNNPLVESGADSEHGTFIWSTIGAIAGNNIGIDGINDRSPVWLGRASGSGEWDLSLTDFVREAKAQKQQNAIVNLSLDLTQVNPDGSVTTRYELTPRERAALEYARQNGVLLVVAAGNDGGVMSVLGQASQEFDNIITVGAFDGVRRSSYSSYGYGLDAVVAVENDGSAIEGTSVAAAKATGIASVVWESNPELSDRQIIDILQQSAIDVNLPSWDRKTGFGVLNLDKAVQLAKETAPQQSTRPEFATPETWGYEGLVKPIERATAQQFNGKSYDWKPYTIKAGDTLSEIAKETMGSAAPDYYKLIAKHNGISNPDVIYEGQKIEIPVEVPASNGSGNAIDKPEQQLPNSISIDGHNIVGKFYPVYEKYQSAIGKPTSDVTNYSDNIRYQLFERGSIVTSPKGTFPIYGSIRQEYLKTGGLDGRLGVPKSGEIDRGNGNKAQYFEGGYIYWNGNKATAYQEPGKPSNSGDNNSGGNSSGGNTSDCYELGSLSEKYETGNRGPGTIGNDPTGGWSYGTYQLATKPGSLAGFLNSEIASKWSSELKALTPGTKTFNNKWKEIASKDAEEFSAAQHEYIKITHYAPLANKLKKTLDLDVNKHSKALQNVIWSTAVQHGANTKLVNNSLKGKNISRMSESELINAIYAERGKKDSAGNLVYFSSSPRNIQKSVDNRFVDERSDALAMLQNPCSGDTNPGKGSNGGTKPAQPGNSGDNDDKDKPNLPNDSQPPDRGNKPVPTKTLSKELNFALTDQSLWGKGKVFNPSLNVSGGPNFDKEVSLGILGKPFAKGGLEYKFQAFLSPGTFDVDFPALFNISYAGEAKAGSSVAVSFKSNLGSEGSLKTELGASFLGEYKLELEAGIKEIPFLGDPSTKFESGAKFDLNEFLLEQFNSPIVLDLGLAATDDEIENNQFKAEDKAFQYVDVVRILKLIPYTRPVGVALEEFGGLEIKAGGNLKQESTLDIKGFEIDFDGKQNGNELKLGAKDSGVLKIDIPQSFSFGEVYKFTPTVKPIVDFSTNLGLTGKVEAVFDLKQVLLEKIGDKLPETVKKKLEDFVNNQAANSLIPLEVSGAAETPKWTFVSKNFDPFSVANFEAKLPELSVKVV